MRQCIILNLILRKKMGINEKAGETQTGFVVDLYYVKVNCPTPKNIPLLCEGRKSWLKCSWEFSVPITESSGGLKLPQNKYIPDF